jgi:FkbM family methyltransferase
MRKLKKATWERCRHPRVVSWLNGLRVQIYPGDETSCTLLLSGLYEPNEFYWLNGCLMPGQTFIDIGANLGLYTIFAAKKVGPCGTVVAIEPSSREFARLKANVELNELSNVRVLRVATSNHSGEADLLVAEEAHSGHNTLGDFGYPIMARGKERVRAMRLDEIVRELGLTRVDVVKIDVEGAEYATLQGAADTVERFKPIILLEVSDRALRHQGASGSQVWDFLLWKGYSINSFDGKTGLPSPGLRKPYFDSENVLATHNTASGHDPLFRQYACWSGDVPAGFAVNFFGVKTRQDYTTAVTRDPSSRSSRPSYVTTTYPDFGEEYFEWIDILESVANADKQFVMIELGAGYGRWLVNAATALRKTRRLVPYLIGVEAEPSHFEMMKQHFRDNDLDPDRHLLMRAAVAPHDGTVRFFVGHSREWYGQRIVPNLNARVEGYPTLSVETVRAVSLNTLLRQLEQVDLIDLDVQGDEYGVLSTAVDELDAKVKRVHIGTHGRMIEKGLRGLFRPLGWRALNDYPTKEECVTPYGKIRFQDGVQSWVNERLCQRSSHTQA